METTVTVSKISDKTSNGNAILTLTTTVKTALGTKSKKYLCAVEYGTQPKLNAKIEIDLNDYAVITRESEFEHVDEDGTVTTRTATNHWLSLK